MNSVLCTISKAVCLLTPPLALVYATAVLGVVMIGYRILMGDLRRAKWTFIALLLMGAFLSPVPNGRGGYTGGFYWLIAELTDGYGACTYIGQPPPLTREQEQEGRQIRGLTCGSRSGSGTGTGTGTGN